MSSSSAMVGSSCRVARSRTSIAIGRLPDGRAEDGRRGAGRGPSAGADATELVANLVRRAAHEDARSAYYPQDHGDHPTPVGPKIPAGRSGISPTKIVNNCGGD